MPTLTSTLLIATGGGYQSGQQSGQPIVLHSTPFLLERIEPSPNNSVQTIRFKQFSTNNSVQKRESQAQLWRLRWYCTSAWRMRSRCAVKMCGSGALTRCVNKQRFEPLVQSIAHSSAEHFAKRLVIGVPTLVERARLSDTWCGHSATGRKQYHQNMECQGCGGLPCPGISI